ncbi:MAG: helix-turn-helix domain-containing protein [Prevotellaceae bacterium]|jgi:excisionase family DNA binding protein|nr:helix-turn-helix domain-containing protein [Prevotellaceae bacterium]
MELQKKVEELENSIKMAGIATKEVLTFGEAAQFTGLSKSYLYKLTSGHRIPHSKPSGKLVYFDRAELQRWLLQNRVSTTEEVENKAAVYCSTGKKGGSHV